MGNKDKKFNPPTGYIVAVHSHIFAIKAVSQYLVEDPSGLAYALEKSGFQLVPDPFDLAADAGKVILEEERLKNGSSDTSTN